jgi:GNAT superfamily N-acetyltransferase
MKVTLRPARTADASAIASILSGWIDETEWMPRIHTHGEDCGFGDFLIDRTNVTVACGPWGDVVGFLARRGGEIDALYVAMDARGQGVGRALLGAAKEAIPNLTIWTFQANVSARQFYSAAGFSAVEWTDGSDNDEGLPDVRMVWRAEGTAEALDRMAGMTA